MRHNERERERERERVGEKYNLRNVLSTNTLKLTMIMLANLWFFVLANLCFCVQIYGHVISSRQGKRLEILQVCHHVWSGVVGVIWGFILG